MKRTSKSFYGIGAFIATLILLISNSLLTAADSNGFVFNSTSFLSYEAELNPDDGLKDGAFKVKRSYLTLKKNVLDGLSFRITLDAHQDATGDMKVRLKYVYAHFKFDDWAFITKPNLEFGLVHTPWLDFEQHINYYRMLGKMFMERSGLFNSADFGFTLGGYFGGEMDDNYKKKVNKKYAGRYGSFALGAYNGGGYHAIEVTENKTVQGRLTVRPIPDIIPGLQLSYSGIFGKSNYMDDEVVDFEAPNWNVNTAMLSYENEYLTVTGQFTTGEGNQKGNFVDAEHKSTPFSGFSAFAEGKLGDHFRVIGRYDNFDNNTDVDDNEEQRIIVGVGYDFGHHNILILDYDKTMYNEEGKDDLDLIKLTMQVSF